MFSYKEMQLQIGTKAAPNLYTIEFGVLTPFRLARVFSVQIPALAGFCSVEF